MVRTGEESSLPFAEWLPLVLILALGAALRLYRLGFENYWIDEVLSIRQAMPSPVEALGSYWNLENSRPLALPLVHYTLRLGDSEFLARLPSALLSVADIGVLFLLARELTSRRVALLAAFLLAVFPLHVWYAQEVRWYAQWSLLTTVSYLALVRAWKNDRFRAWVGYGTVALLSLYTFVVTIQILASHVASALLLPDQGRKRSFYIKLLVSLAGISILALPTFLVALGLYGGGPSETVGTPRATGLAVLPYTFFAYVAGYTIGPTVTELHSLPGSGRILQEFPEVLLYFAVFAPLAALGLWRLRARSAASAILIPWVIGFPLLVMATAVVGGQTYNVRYTLVALPGFALLLSVGLDSLARRQVRWLATGLVLACFAASLGNFYWNQHYDKENIQGAVAQIRASRFDEEPVVVIGQAMETVAYYGPELEIMRIPWCTSGEVGTGLTDVTDLQVEFALWVLVSRDWEKRSRACMERLEETHRTVMSRSFTGVDLWLLRR